MKVEIGPYNSDGEDRKVEVVVEDYDVWSMDHTLAQVIAPMLRKMKESKHGAPYVDDEDVPEELRSTSAPPKENKWDTDDLFFKRWDWVLDELIWTFESIIEDDYLNDVEARQTNGLRLFAKYYRALWT